MVPLTDKVGIIEWVENADVFMKLIEKNNSGAYKRALIEYKSFCENQSKKFKTSEHPLRNCSRDEIIPFYQKLANHFPDDLLR